MRRALELAVGPVLLCLVAEGLGSLAVFAIAVGLSVVYIGATVAVAKAARRLVVVRTVDRYEVVEGQPITLRFEVAGLRGLPAGLEVFCRCGRWHELPGGESIQRCVIDRPGHHVIEPSLIRIRDDLGLFARPLTAGEPEDVLVLPTPAAVPAPVRRGAADASSDPEPDGLRPYVRGTPMSRIHWPSAARGGELQERAFTTAHDHLPLVVVDTAGAPSGASVDWASRQAAGHVLAFARAGGCRVLLPGDRRPTTLMDATAGWAALHRRLAALGRGTPTDEASDMRSAVHVRAALAPAGLGRELLPPGVVAAGEWAEA